MTDIIQRHSKRVNQIIENTLQLSRRSEPSIEEVDLSAWVSKIVSEFRSHQKPEARINLKLINDKVTARFDPSQMEQVLINLVDNGIRHSIKEDSEAQLFVVLSETHDNGQAYIEVIDQGSGVSEENTHHLFEPFFTTETQGTGLGLYLSREICEANQAHLDYVDPNYDEFKGHWEFNDPTVLKKEYQELVAQNLGACFRIVFAHHKRII